MKKGHNGSQFFKCHYFLADVEKDVESLLLGLDWECCPLVAGVKHGSVE